MKFIIHVRKVIDAIKKIKPYPQTLNPNPKRAVAEMFDAVAASDAQTLRLIPHSPFPSGGATPRNPEALRSICLHLDLLLLVHEIHNTWKQHNQCSKKKI